MRDLRTLQPALVTPHNHLMWFSFAYGFRHVGRDPVRLAPSDGLLARYPVSIASPRFHLLGKPNPRLSHFEQ
jgi:hypothetical protein